MQTLRLAHQSTWHYVTSNYITCHLVIFQQSDYHHQRKMLTLRLSGADIRMLSSSGPLEAELSRVLAPDRSIEAIDFCAFAAFMHSA